MRVLIVEDELLLVMDLEDMLRQWGYDVCGSARDTGEALAKAGNLRPDLVLMDIQLANNNSGLDAARLIRDGLGIPSLFVTGNPDQATVKDMELLDPVAILSKPVQPERLREALFRAEQQLPCG